MVRPIRVALLGGIAVAVAVVAMYVVRPIPDPVVALFGGATELEREGGVRIWFRPPAATMSLADTVAGRTAAVRPCAASDPAPCSPGVLVLEYARLDEDIIPELVDVLAHGGFAVHEVLETDLARRLEPFAAPGVELALDEWRSENGERHEDPYLRARDRRDLERTIADAA
jgi:hypothetical protein